MMNIHNIIGLYLAVYFIFQASNVIAQTNTVPEGVLTNAQIRAEWLRTNFTNPEMRAQWVRSNADARAEYRRLHPTENELKWVSNAMQHMEPAKTWPLPSKKQDTFERCMNSLRSAINTNQIEIACSRMSNAPETALALKDFTKVAFSNLDEYADIFTRSELSSDFGHAGYIARAYDPTNYFFFIFWSEDGPVKQAEKRTPDALHVLAGCRFYENGKLQEFRLNSPNGQGHFQSNKVLSFKENGELDSFWVRPQDSNP